MLNQGGNAYFKANPDVAAAFAKDAYGMSADAFASTHFNKFGATEGRVAPAPAAMPNATLSAGAAYAAKPGGIGAAKFDQNIRDYLAVNPTATAAQKRTEMDLYGISDQDVSRATMPVAPVVARNSPSIAAPAPSPTGLLTQGSRSYFQANPDVAEAFSKDSFGMTESQFADTHFTKFGAAEGRASPASAAVPKTTLSAGMTYASRQGGIGADAYYSNIRNWANSTPGATESDRQREMQAYGVSEEDWSRSGAVLRPALVADPAAAPVVAPAAAELNRGVNARNETIEGRIQGLLGTDAQGNYTNPVVRQASDRAMQTFAGRGLLNSSMAQQAAIEAAVGKAIEIAGPDAQTYFSQGRANQDAGNVFARDELSFARDMQKQAAQFAQQDKELAQRGGQFDREFGLKGQELAQRGGQFDRELASKFDLAKLDITSRTQATELAQKNALEINNIAAVNSQFDLYLRRISEIDSNKDFDDVVKVKLKNEAGADFDTFARAANIVRETMGGRYTVAAPAANTTAPTGATGGMLSQGDNFA
jgi:hypothetical protein